MKLIMTLASSALMLAGSVTISTAQTTPDDPMMMRQQQQQQEENSTQSGPAGERWRDSNPSGSQDDQDRFGRDDQRDDIGNNDRDRDRAGRYDNDRRGKPDMGWRHDRRDRDDRDRHARMRGHHMGPGMMRMMIILMDTDNDGALSLEEVIAVHERLFKAVDSDSDGRVTLEEMQDFMRDMKGPGGR